MHRHLLLASFAILLFVGLGRASAADFSRGQLLYENHCVGCHESVVHIREQRKVVSLAALRAQVAHRARLQGLRWSEEDVDDVALYLDTRYYKFHAAPRGG